MNTMERSRDILTPEQAAAYLQVNRETVYRYIRQGKLAASRLGRSYRIPRRSLDRLLWSTRTRPDIPLRDYTSEQIAEFLRADALDAAAQEVVARFGRHATAP
jgi:excisionase family DNA binding protein